MIFNELSYFVELFLDTANIFREQILKHNMYKIVT